MKKVLCLIESLGSGGAERQMTGLACMLKDNGIDVSVATYDSQDFYKSSLIEHGIEPILASTSSSLLVRLWKIGCVVRLLKPDVVISYSRASSIVACVGKALGAKYKLIVSERNTTQVISKSELIKFKLYKYADVIVPNSYSQYSFIKQMYSQLISRTIVITNFVDTVLFQPHAKKERGNMFLIIVVARVQKQKNVINFIKSLKMVAAYRTDFHVKWYGCQSDDNYFSKCMKMVEDYGLSQQIEFVKPSSNISEEYNNADFFCLPSIYEGYPNVICEAMSSGLPVICSNVCDNPRIVEEGVNGFLFNPESVYDMASALEKMLSMGASERKIMGYNNRQKVLKNHSMQEFVNKYLAIISE